MVIRRLRGASLRLFGTAVLVTIAFGLAPLTFPRISQATSHGVPKNSPGEWTPPVDITQPSDAHHPAYGVLQCDRYERTHVFWADNIDTGSGSPAIFHRSEGNGEWSIPNEVIVPPGNVVQLRVAVSKNADTVHMVWMNGAGIVTVYHSKAPLAYVDEAKAWHTPNALVDNAESVAFQIDRNGVIHLVYVVPGLTTAQHEVLYTRSFDDGLTWSVPIAVATPTSNLPSLVQLEMALDNRARIHVGITVRSIDYGAESTVEYVRSVDGGQTWLTPVMIQNRPTAYQGVAWIAPFAFGNDEIFLTWHDPRRMYQRSTDGGASWSQPREIMSLGAAFGGENPIVQDSGGFLHIVLAARSGVYVLDWDGQSWVFPQRIESRNLDPHGQALAICQGNRIHAIYYDNFVTKGDLADAQNRVWWAVRELNTPSIPRQVPATPSTGSSALSPQATASAVSVSTPPYFGVVRDTDPPTIGNSTDGALLTALAPLIFVLLGPAFLLWRRRH